VNELEDKLNSILNNPAEMEKITRLASELMGGGRENPSPPESTMPDGELLGRLTKLLGSAGGGNDKAELLRAMSPYLRPERQAKLKKALRLAKVARLAAAALGDGEGGRDV